MPSDAAAPWVLLAIGAVLALAMLVAGCGATESCRAPHHWVAVHCSKGCIYECR